MQATVHTIGNAFIAVLITLIPFYGIASHFDGDDEVIVTSPIDGNAYLAGGTVEIEATISGDLITAGGELHIRDSIHQDILAAGGNIDIYQHVGGDVRVTGGSIRIYRSVGGDVVVMGGDVQIEKDAVVGGDLIVFSGSVRVDGDVRGRIHSSSGEITVNGSVENGMETNSGTLRINGAISGNSKLSAGSIKLGDRASFSGDVRYFAGSGEMDFSPHMQGGAQATFDESLKSSELDFDWKTLGMGMFIFFILRLIAAFLIIVFTLLLLRSFLRRATRGYDQHWMRNIGFGLLYLFVLPIVSIILMMTVVGIPLGLFSLGVYGLSMLILPAMVAAVAAFATEQYYNAHWGYGRLLMVSLGMYIIFRILMWIPIINILLWVVILAWGIGTIITGFGKRTEAPAEELI